MVFGDSPNKSQVNTKVIMDQYIAETGYRFPIYLWVLLHQFFGQVVRGLADDFKVAYDRVLSFIISLKRYKIKVFGIGSNLMGRDNNVLQ